MVSLADKGYAMKKSRRELFASSSKDICRTFIQCDRQCCEKCEKQIPCTEIRVNVDKNTGETNIWNDGESIPVQFDEDEKCYVHSLIFGQLLTSSNYDDKDERYDISGRNGIGVKQPLSFLKNSALKVLILRED